MIAFMSTNKRTNITANKQVQGNEVNIIIYLNKETCYTGNAVEF
jgi:hypothetical protein